MKYVILFFMILASCSIPESKEEKEAREEMEFLKGEYVYLDNQNTLHFKTNCLYLLGPVLKGESNSSPVGVKRVLKTEVTDSMLMKCCPDCVTDSRYKTLLR